MKLVITDLDDTILKSDDADFTVWRRHKKTGRKEKLNSEEYAKDPYKGNSQYEYDFSALQDDDAIFNNILNASPLLQNLKLINFYVKNGYKVCFLTARAQEQAIKKAIKIWLNAKKNDMFDNIGSAFVDDFSHAINDRKYAATLGGMKDPERKQRFIKRACERCEHVLFIDDDPRNLDAARALPVNNLTVIEQR